MDVGILCDPSGKGGGRRRALSDSTYTVYIIHSIPVLLVPWIMRNWEFPLLPKFAILSIPTLVLAFGMAWLIRKLPFASRVL